MDNSDVQSNISDTSSVSDVEDTSDAKYEVDVSEYVTEIPSDQPLNSDFTDLIKQKHDPERHKLNAAYAIIRRYLVDNKLILTGGMAIDTALRAKGAKLYEIEKIDYDFITDDFHNDAYKIALAVSHVKQLASVHVINAMHTSTMRVRYNYTYIADSTYIHKKSYKLIPTLEYDGLRVAHPCYQVLDQHMALSHPYSNSPLENVLYKRWRHDITRYELLYLHYDLADEMIRLSKNKTGFITEEKLPTIKRNVAELDLTKYLDECLSGYVAYAYWMNKADPKNYKFEVTGNVLHYTTETPIVTVLSDNFPKLLDKLNIKSDTADYYNSFTDKLESRITHNNIEILNSNGTLVSAHKVGKIYVAGIQQVMLYLGVKALFFDDDLAAEAYANLSRLFLKSIKEKNTTFVFDLETYGKYNRSDNEELLIEKQCGMMNSKKVASSVPAHYYPKDGMKFPTFDLENATGYDFDGQKVDRIDLYRVPDVCEDIIR